MRKLYHTIFPILALGILGAAAFFAMALISSPPPQPADVPATDFSAGRAMQDLAVIAHEPHPMGVSQARAAVRNYLQDEVRRPGLEPQVQKIFGVRVVHPGSILDEFVLRFDGMPVKGVEMEFELDTSNQFQILVVEEKTGLPSLGSLARVFQPSPMLAGGSRHP